MSVKDFLKSKIAAICMQLAAVCFIGMFLLVYNMNMQAVLFVSMVYLFVQAAALFIEFFPKHRYYTDVKNGLAQLDKKYLLSSLLDEPSFYEGMLLDQCLRICQKSMRDEILLYRNASREYREYIELWIHEVKTPIASSRLIIENNPSPVTKDLSEELDVIDYYLEQALFYSRSSNVEKDYNIKKIQLMDLSKQVIRKNAKSFIKYKVKLDLAQADAVVYTDEKWVEYIINQILTNSIKYRKENPQISIFIQDRAQSVSLFIKDNGIGIPKKDLGRVFEKGFTGTTGRNYKKATGMGLYLVKQLCDKLSLSVSIASAQGQGTTVELVFPKTELAELVQSVQGAKRDLTVL